MVATHSTAHCGRGRRAPDSPRLPRGRLRRVRL